MPIETPALSADTRRDILDVVTRWCRGLDRNDRELLVSCYHPGAVFDHGGHFVGAADGLVDQMLEANSMITSAQHAISNHLVLGANETGAVVETLVHARYVLKSDPNKIIHSFGRFVDRFDKRDGQWLISERVFVMDCATAGAVMDPSEYHGGKFGVEDPSYQMLAKLDTTRSASSRV